MKWRVKLKPPQKKVPSKGAATFLLMHTQTFPTLYFFLICSRSKILAIIIQSVYVSDEMQITVKKKARTILRKKFLP